MPEALIAYKPTLDIDQLPTNLNDAPDFSGWQLQKTPVGVILFAPVTPPAMSSQMMK